MNLKELCEYLDSQFKFLSRVHNTVYCIFSITYSSFFIFGLKHYNVKQFLTMVVFILEHRIIFLPR